MSGQPGRDEDAAARGEGDMTPRGEEPLSREDLIALRDHRLTRVQARAVRARLSRDPSALALLGTLAHEAGQDAAPSEAESAAPGAGDNSSTAVAERPRRWLYRAGVVAIGLALLATALAYARHVAVQPTDVRAAPVFPVVNAANLATLWPSIDGQIDENLLKHTEICRGTLDVLAARPALVSGRYAVVMAYQLIDEDLSVSDQVQLEALPVDCLSFNDRMGYVRVRR